MTIELGVSPRALSTLFDSNEIRTGMVREVPGGATIQLGEILMEKRDLPSIQASAFVTVLLTFGSGVISGVVVNLLSSWLTEKLKGDDKGRRMMCINRKLVEVTTSEAMTRILTETIEIEERK